MIAIEGDQARGFGIVVFDDVRRVSAGFEPIEKSSELNGARPVDAADIREIDFDIVTVIERRLDVRNGARDGCRVLQIEWTVRNETGEVSGAIGVDENTHMKRSRSTPSVRAIAGPGTVSA